MALNYEAKWCEPGHALSEIIHSLALAPREKFYLAVIDWSPNDNTLKRVGTEVREALSHLLQLT